MKQNILSVGLDVDDTQYHGSAFNKVTGEVIDFKCRPTLKGLLQQLDRMARHFKGHQIKLCSEATCTVSSNRSGSKLADVALHPAFIIHPQAT